MASQKFRRICILLFIRNICYFKKTKYEQKFWFIFRFNLSIVISIYPFQFLRTTSVGFLGAFISFIFYGTKICEENTIQTMWSFCYSISIHSNFKNKRTFKTIIIENGYIFWISSNHPRDFCVHSANKLYRFIGIYSWSIGDIRLFCSI